MACAGGRSFSCVIPAVTHQNGFSRGLSPLVWLLRRSRHLKRLTSILLCGISYSVVFVESRAFTRRLAERGGGSAEAVLVQIQEDLLENPERGVKVRGLGGIRKARASNPGRGKGKRGGFRYLYLYIQRRDHIHLLFLLDKDEQEDLSAEQRKILRGLVAALK
jgi:hypothetical protein